MQTAYVRLRFGMARRSKVIYTVGHSTRTIDELVRVLASHGVSRLVDIRTIRRSRTNPQFNEARFARALARRGIDYVALPALGGRRGKAKRPPRRSNEAWRVAAFRNFADYALGSEFRAGLAELRTLARTKPTAIMCAEAVWWRCHRRIVADHLLARGVPVVHLMTETKSEPATLTPFAVASRGSVSYPLTSSGSGSRSGRGPSAARPSPAARSS